MWGWEGGDQMSDGKKIENDRVVYAYEDKWREQ